MKTVHAARGHWKSIHKTFIEERYLVNKHGPCPICEGKDRFRYDNKDGNGTSICNNCGSMDGIGLLMRVTGWDFKEAAHEIDNLLGNNKLPKDEIKPAPDKTKLLSFISSKLVPVVPDDNIDKYLKSRGINEYDPRYFRKLQDFQYRDQGEILGSADCMVAVITDSNNQRIGYHCTYIKNGIKAEFVSPKKIFGNMGGGCIRLGQPKNGVLAIAEGIETALAVTQYNGWTCWAAINSGNMEKFIPPKDITTSIVVADNDKSYTGQASAYILAKKIKAKGLNVWVEMPQDKGDDYLDWVLKQ